MTVFVLDFNPCKYWITAFICAICWNWPILPFWRTQYLDEELKILKLVKELKTYRCVCINTGISADGLSRNLKDACISGERRPELEGKCLWGKHFALESQKRIFPSEMKQSICCRSHGAAMAEIKLLNVKVLGAHTFLMCQSHINPFIPCNSYTKDSLKCLTYVICFHNPCVVSA